MKKLILLSVILFSQFGGLNYVQAEQPTHPVCHLMCPEK